MVQVLVKLFLRPVNPTDVLQAGAMFGDYQTPFIPGMHALPRLELLQLTLSHDFDAPQAALADFFQHIRCIFLCSITTKTGLLCVCATCHSDKHSMRW